MKKIWMIGAAIALFTTAEVKAQNVRWGIEGGYNLNYLTHLGGAEMSKSRSGGFGGILADIGSGHFTFQPGLRYIYKGGEYGTLAHDGLWRIETNNRVGLQYIEMPLNVVWHSGGSANGLMIGGGGFVSFLASGRNKYSITTQSMVEGAPPATTVEGNRKLDIGDLDHGGTSRWDAGLGAFVGYQFTNGLFAKAGAEWGLMSLQKNAATGEYSVKNMNFLFSLGYMLRHNKCKDK